jgi:hypothetical protein
MLAHKLLEENQNLLWRSGTWGRGDFVDIEDVKVAGGRFMTECARCVECLGASVDRLIVICRPLRG